MVGRAVLMLALLAALAILTDSAEEQRSTLHQSAQVGDAEDIRAGRVEPEGWVPRVSQQILVSDEVAVGEESWLHAMREQEGAPPKRRRLRRRKLRRRTTDAPLVTASLPEEHFLGESQEPTAPGSEREAPLQPTAPAPEPPREDGAAPPRRRIKLRRRGGKRKIRVRVNDASPDRKEPDEDSTEIPSFEQEVQPPKIIRLNVNVKPDRTPSLQTSTPESDRAWQHRQEWERPTTPKAEDHSSMQHAEESNEAKDSEDSTEQEQFKSTRKPTLDHSIISDKSYRRPFSSAKQKQNDLEGATQHISLKEILKKSGSHSLSEVLQNNNLSLSDLLSGKRFAISALTLTTTKQPATVHHRRLPQLTTTVQPQSTTEKVVTENTIKHKPRPTIQVEKTIRPMRPIINKYHWKLSQVLDKQEQREKEQKTAETVINDSQDTKELKSKEVVIIPEERQSRFTDITALPNYEEDEMFLSEETAGLNDKLPIENIANKKLDETSINLDEPNEWTNYVDETNNVTSSTTVTTTTIDTTTARNVFTFPQQITNSRLNLKPRLRLPPIKVPPKRISLTIETPKKETLKYDKTLLDLESIFHTTKGLSRGSDKYLNPSSTYQTTAPNKYETSTSISFNISYDENKIVDSYIPEEKALETDSTVVVSSPITVKAGSSKAIYATTQLITKVEDVKQEPVQEIETTQKINTVSNQIINDEVDKKAVKPESNGKEELLEILKDSRGGERLARVLAERNMTLNELVEHRERGSSQVHLADIFHNASKEPNPDEPFLAKSSIEPMSKQTYPLRALIEANRHDVMQKLPGKLPEPTPLAELMKNDEHLGIVTLFDKFHNKKISPKDIKRDSDGASYFTSVSNIMPLENDPKLIDTKATVKMMPRSNFDENVKLQAWGLIAPSLGEQFAQRITAGPPSPDYSSLRVEDVDGDGVIVLDDIQQQQAGTLNNQVSNQKRYNDRYDDVEQTTFFKKMPVSVQSAIIASSSIVGISIVVFLAAFMMCRWRQKRKNVLRYDCRFNADAVRSSILHRRAMHLNNSSRSISPILDDRIFKNQKLSTLDSQEKRDEQDYLWETIRRPFQ